MLDLLKFMQSRKAPRELAFLFHRALAFATVETVIRLSEKLAEQRVSKTVQPVTALGGGCFQNGLLLELMVNSLRQQSFDVCWPQKVPPNDGGLAWPSLYRCQSES